jgi:PAS domain S-box-containing protein
MESSLRDSEERFRLITENASALIAELDLEGNFIFANSGFYKLLKYNPDSLVHKNLHAIFPDDEKKRVKSFLEDLTVYPGKSFKQTWRLQRSDGAIKTFKSSLNVNTYSSGEKTLILIANDISEQLEYQKQIKHNMDLYRTLAINIPNMNMFLFDHELKILIADGSEMEALGLAKNELEGKNLYELMQAKKASSFIPVLIRLFEKAILGAFSNNEYEHEGEYYRLKVLPVKGDIGKSGLCIMEKVTKEKKDNEALKKAKETAEKASQVKTRFLANMSHEIRTPLNAIIGFNEQMYKTGLNEKQEKFTDLIYESSDHLLTIVNDVLTLTKSESGSIPMDQVPFSPAKVFSDITELLKYKAQKKGIEFHLSLPMNPAQGLIGDPARLKQILINLVNNAIKFTEKGAVHLSYSLDTDSRDMDLAHLIISVKDTGIGIPVEKQNTIFEEFTQLDSRSTRKYGGSGLGLTVTKRLVDELNGQIKVESEVNQGTEFTIQLPFLKANADQLKQAPEYEIEPDILKGVKLMLVDDDATNRLLGKTIMDEWGVEITEAENGLEALEKSQEKRYDIILMDIHMPHLDGHDATAAIRKTNDNPNRDSKILALTANVIRKDIKHFMQSGMDDYLLKPFKEKELFEKLFYWQNHERAPGQQIKFKQEKEEGLLTGKQGQDGESLEFDLEPLKKASNGNPGFVKEMINLFLNNIEGAREKFIIAIEDENWNLAGEVAHKLIPSLEHLNIRGLARQLKNIENRTIKSNKPENVHEELENVLERSKKIVSQLGKELNAIG